MKKFQLINPQGEAVITLFDSDFQAKKHLTFAKNTPSPTQKELDEKWAYFQKMGWKVEPKKVTVN